MKVCSGYDDCNPPERETLRMIYRTTWNRTHKANPIGDAEGDALTAVAAHVRQQQAAKIERQNTLIKVHYDLLRERDAEIERLRRMVADVKGSLCDIRACLQHCTEVMSRAALDHTENALFCVLKDSTPATGDTAPSFELRDAQLESVVAALKERIGIGNDE